MVTIIVILHPAEKSEAGSEDDEDDHHHDDTHQQHVETSAGHVRHFLVSRTVLTDEDGVRRGRRRLEQCVGIQERSRHCCHGHLVQSHVAEVTNPLLQYQRSHYLFNREISLTKYISWFGRESTFTDEYLSLELLK